MLQTAFSNASSNLLYVFNTTPELQLAELIDMINNEQQSMKSSP
jgi:hypothetical protein